MPRRILAAATVVLIALMLAPGRLSGEPTAPITAVASSTTSTLPDILGHLDTSQPNPLRLYPRRPGARYEDVEARTGAAVAVGGTQLRLTRVALDPRGALPRGSRPARARQYERVGLVDGYAPRTVDTTGTLLLVVLNVVSVFPSTTPMCIATLAGDGRVLLPYSGPPPKPKQVARETTTTIEVPTKPFDVRLYFPLGTYRGRVYLTCDGFPSTIFSDYDEARAVWGLDV